MTSRLTLLTASQMRDCDYAAIAAGTPGITLMERAGQAVADIILTYYSKRSVLVVCGTGHNGGDGMVIARLLKEKGWPVQVALSTDPAGLSGDARMAAEAWRKTGGNIESALNLESVELVVDALFGFGLTRPIEGAAKEWIDAVNAARLPIVSVDLPSGIHADSGQIMGAAVHATHTVTFTHPKPGLYLQPGRVHAGTIHVADIGIPADSSAQTQLNDPSLWQHLLPVATPFDHKYTRGHALVSGGPEHATGASRLAALAAARIGAGLVSMACTPSSLPVYAASLLSIMTKPCRHLPDFRAIMADARIRGVLIGPGHGINTRTREFVLAALGTRRPVVIDADALTAFARSRRDLLDHLHADCVLTPHEGEFARLFALRGSRLERAREAARQAGAVILLKGSDTIIASPDGRAVINHNAPPCLATAGAGDVLAGCVLGLIVQGMPVFEAACASVWLHAEAAAALGTGLIADDLPHGLAQALRKHLPQASPFSHNACMQIQKHVIIHGRVQGVSYRAWTCATARTLGLTGWVRNLTDDTVEAVFEGPPSQVDVMLKECLKGPPAARVERIDTLATPPQAELLGFTSRPTANPGDPA